MPMHTGDQGCQANGRVHENNRSPVFDAESGCRQHIVKVCLQFMAGNGGLTGPVDPAAADFAVRWVADHEVKGFRIHKPADKTHIPANNTAPRLKMVYRNIHRAKAGQILLQFQTDQGKVRMKSGQDQADDAAAAAQIEHPLGSVQSAEMGGKDGIHRKTIAIAILAANQSAVEQAVIGERPALSSVSGLPALRDLSGLFFIPVIR